jgi:dTDP-D-glucose 4,6-dehydratase
MLVIDKSNWDGKAKAYHGDCKVKVLEVGKSVIKQIKLLAQDVEYGNPSKYDIRITKSGNGKDTRYTVTPSPAKTELTEEEKTAVENAPTIAELNKIPDRETVIGFDLQILKDVDAGFEGTSSESKSSADEDWDNF